MMEIPAFLELRDVPDRDELPPPSGTPASFWSNVAKKGRGECWPWIGRVDRYGYGLCGPHYVEHTAHRQAYFFDTGLRPGEQVVRHSCDNPICCNPEHLLLGTQGDNINDMVRRGRTAKGVKNGRAKATEKQVEELRVGRLSVREYCERTGVDRSTAYATKRGEIWK